MAVAPSRSLRRALAVALVAIAAPACGEDSSHLACPLLMPGTLALHPDGGPLPVSADGEASLTGTAAGGHLVAHPAWLGAGQAVKIVARSEASSADPLSRGPLVAIAYGPRNGFGGYSHCRALKSGQQVELTLAAETAGEYLVLVGTPPGTPTTPAAAVSYTVTTTCTAGCDSSDLCPTLAERGCPDVRCDGELARDEAGCPTCECRTDTLCGPDRRAGPAGACVLPACACPAGDSPVCGADGRTWPSRCEAACALVPVAREGPCEITCPALDTCEAPCFGLRTIGTDGCPTCACRARFADDAASCGACPLVTAPVCGSDGLTYTNACRARCNGARILYAGACREGCTSPPPDCALDCAHGLRPVAGGTHCLACACASVPASCDPEGGAPVCVTLPGPIGETTVGSACLALALGAGDDGARWGACGERCGDERPCPEGASCAQAGFLEGRCLLDGDAGGACGCSALVTPVCGRVVSPGPGPIEALESFDNACLARCAGAVVVHEGPCCESAVSCDGGEVAQLDTAGCPVACGPARSGLCASTAAFSVACDLDGEPVGTSACEAHLAGEEAFVEACR